MPTWSAAITGFVAGLVYWCWALLIPKLHIDDPLDTVARKCLRVSTVHLRPLH